MVATMAGQPAITVPVTLRALAPTGTTSFSGVLTGGNGRGANTGEAEFYQFDLPAGQPALNSSITLADNPDNATNAWLVNTVVAIPYSYVIRK
jgi:hypothetical protein